MGRYSGLPLLVLAAVLQGAVLPEFRIGGAGFDLVLLIVLSWTILMGAEEGAIWAVVGGLLHDLAGGRLLGTGAVAMVAASGAVSLIFNEVGRGNLIVPPLAAAVGTVVFQTVLIVVLNVFGSSVPVFYALVNVTLISVLYNVPLMIVVFRVVGWLARPSGRGRRMTF
ncbi:MAG TPA: rod shape-determining protein MreD [Aggregatilineales bacterium]|nr:rod shape-determining protein MreD [Anaerolineales bacterium]HRE49720.1 rod shape-determining protein MreD [Aggregatilineales bacterium]